MDNNVYQGIKPDVDSWVPEVPDVIFKAVKGFILAPISSVWNIENDPALDVFNIQAKKCYNGEDMRNHVCLYLNYFEKYYDQDKELFMVIANIKWMMRYRADIYKKENFIFDIKRYILSQTIVSKVEQMVEDHYALNLNYNNISNPPLQYTNSDAKKFMSISILMCFVIPLITHFAQQIRIGTIDEFILECYEPILYYYESEVDIYAKLRETSYTNVAKNEKMNALVWDKQSIRGKDTVTHSIDSVDNIILNLIPKYNFNQNMVNMNWVSIQKNTKFKITDIGFEFTFIPLSSSRRDEDSVSDYDKFEATQTKQSEALYLQNKANCAHTMKTIQSFFKPFNPAEIAYHEKFFSTEEGGIHPFQQTLCFNLFYKYFGDTTPVYANNINGVIKLILAAKWLLQNQRMILLPYIISGRVDKLVARKSLNIKEKQRVEASKYYPMVMEKYQNEKIIKQILSTIATLISSDFSIVDFEHQELTGRHLDVLPEVIIEEYLAYTLLI